MSDASGGVREPGYYWVTTFGVEDRDPFSPIVAYWAGDVWRIIGDGTEYPGRMGWVILSPRLEPPPRGT